MIRGVPGVWYCCDIARRAGKEGKDGSTRLGPKPKKKTDRMEEFVVKIERSGWFGCSRLAIVAVSLPHCQSVCWLVDAIDIVNRAEKSLRMKEYTESKTLDPAFRSLLNVGVAVERYENGLMMTGNGNFFKERGQR